MVELTNFRMIDSTIKLWLDIRPLLLVILTIYENGYYYQY